MINSIFNNPFSDGIYQTAWLKYFGGNTNTYSFKSIKGTRFISHAFMPYYINVGSNTTNGMVYEIDASTPDYKNKAFMIYDVPSYYNLDYDVTQKLKVKKIKQLSGFATDLRGFDSIESLIKATFSSGSRKRFKRCFKRLEASCAITYKTVYQSLDSVDYQLLMKQFKALIIKRYDELGIDVNLIDMWPFFTELVETMIIEKKAALFIIYSYNKPISMSLVFLNKNTLFNAVKAFDSDYYRFNIGHLDITKIMEWSFNNAIEFVDFSKGEYEYKTRWTNIKYHYDCHIIYDRSSLKASVMAIFLARLMAFKQFLRTKNVNVMYSKFKFMFKNKGKTIQDRLEAKIEEITEIVQPIPNSAIDIEQKNYMHIKRIILDRLYNTPEPLANIKVYRLENKNESFYVQGEKNNYKIKFY